MKNTKKVRNTKKTMNKKLAAVLGAAASFAVTMTAVAVVAADPDPGAVYLRQPVDVVEVHPEAVGDALPHLVAPALGAYDPLLQVQLVPDPAPLYLLGQKGEEQPTDTVPVTTTQAVPTTVPKEIFVPVFVGSIYDENLQENNPYLKLIANESSYEYVDDANKYPAGVIFDQRPSSGERVPPERRSSSTSPWASRRIRCPPSPAIPKRTQRAC